MGLIVMGAIVRSTPALRPMIHTVDALLNHGPARHRVYTSERFGDCAVHTVHSKKVLLLPGVYKPNERRHTHSDAPPLFWNRQSFAAMFTPTVYPSWISYGGSSLRHYTPNNVNGRHKLSPGEMIQVTLLDDVVIPSYFPARFLTAHGAHAEEWLPLHWCSLKLSRDIVNAAIMGNVELAYHPLARGIVLHRQPMKLLRKAVKAAAAEARLLPDKYLSGWNRASHQTLKKYQDLGNYQSRK